MSGQHKGKFTWGVGPQKVCVAGNFNDWSGDATPLNKLEDGSFAADVPLPWGEKQAFKYVVDGEWKVREDEAKEWDAAGNMNNVYTAPHAPASTESSSASSAAPAAASAAAVAPSTLAKSEGAPVEKAPIPSPGETHTNPIPPVSEVPVEKAPVPSPGPTNTDPFNAAPSSTAATNGNTVTRSGAAPIVLGSVISGSGSGNAIGSGNAFHASAPNTDASTATPGHTAPVLDKSAPEAIEKVAANANIGQEATEHEQTLLERAQAYGAGAATTLTTALGQAAHVVEDATGIQLTHGDPMTVEEARAKGIDIDSLDKKDGPTDATSPVGQAPPKAAVADLEQKVQELKVADSSSSATSAPVKKDLAAVPLPGGEPPKTMTGPSSDLPTVPKDDEPKHDLPAQNETSQNHTVVPAPTITAISARDPQKDRTIDAPAAADTAGTKPISSDPAIDPKQAKKEAEQNPALTGSTEKAAQTSDKTNLGVSTHRPDAPETNHDAPAPVTKDIAPGQAAPAPVAKEAPGTPVKAANGASSANTTPASTPAKSTHGKEASSASDVKKRKSGFFGKIKTAFSPKHKEDK